MSPVPTAVALLEDGPAYELPERVLDAAEDLGARTAALYVVDLEGRVLRAIGDHGALPAQLAIPQAVGPELPRRQALDLSEGAPGAIVAPLWLRHRALGVLVALGGDPEALELLAHRAAVAMELATGYTDRFAIARRRRGTTPASELQESLLPPRVTAAAGLEVVGAVLPAYEVGGDWFDHAGTDDGAWVVIADAMGKGARASALSALCVAAQRAARRAGADLPGVADALHHAVCAFREERVSYLTAIVGRWHAPSRTFSWVVMGHPPPLLLRAGAVEVEELRRRGSTPAGLFDDPEAHEVHHVELAPGDRLVLYSDGVTERRDRQDRRLEVEGLLELLRDVRSGTAASLVTAVLEGVGAAHDEALRDDATVVALRCLGQAGEPPAAGVDA